jgi:hypothetical protein
MGHERAFGLFSANITCAIRLRITDQNGKTVDAGCMVLVAANSGLGAAALLSRTQRA